MTIRVSNPNPYVVPNTMAQSVAFGPTPVSITANGFVDIKRFLFAVPVGSVENVYSIAQMPTALVTFEGAPINPATYAGTGIAGDYRLPDEGCTQVLGIVVTAQPKVLAATGKTTKPLAIVGMILIAMGVLALEANRQRLHKRH